MADWKKIKEEVNEKIIILQALDESQQGTVLYDNIMRDLIMPAVTHLARFCECVQEDGNNEEIKLST